MIRHRGFFALVLSLGCSGCGVGAVDDGNLDGDGGISPRPDGDTVVPSDSGTIPGTDSGTIPGIDSGPGADAGTPDPGPSDAPGGPLGAAPVVGCVDAERPARRDDAATSTCEATGAGRCWFVSPEGNDTNAGTFAAPFGTPQAAVRQAGPGDVIYLRGGVYDDTNAHDYAPVQWSNASAGLSRGFISIRAVSLPAWAGGDNYNTPSGTAAAPITIRSFPGERACASGAGSIRIGSISQESAYWRIEDITLHRGAFFLGGGTGNEASPQNQTHDIELRRNEVYEYAGSGPTNVGLIKVGRGDGGGPYRITIESNILHDLIPIDPDGVTREWNTTHDNQHYGAVTTLSCERYISPDCGGNGELTIQNNHIYHVPQAFYFKNPARGPVNVRGNVIRDVGNLGGWVPSNITFEGNLVYRAGTAQGGGSGGETDDSIFLRSGHNLIIRNNTFIGIDRLVIFRVYASGHTIRGNVVQGLRRSLSERSWDNIGYVAQNSSWIHPDTTANAAASQLATGNDFDDNCFVTDVADFIAYGRRYDPGGGVLVSHFSLDEARTTLSHELTSDVVDNVADAFVDFAGGDYRVNDAGACAGRGATVPDWAQP